MSGPDTFVGMVGSHAAFLLGGYPTEATAIAAAHAAIDDALARAPDDEALARRAVATRAALGRPNAMSDARPSLEECARANYIELPAFAPTDAWLAAVRATLEPIVRARPLAYGAGVIAGDLNRHLFVMRTLLSLGATDLIDARRAAFERDIERLRGLHYEGATAALRRLDARPDLVDDAWIESCLAALGSMAHQFIDEPLVAEAQPTPEEHALLAQILREPERDDVREQYAVLAHRRGDPRARLVQLQLAARDLRRGGVSAAYGDKLRQASALIAANPAWTDAVAALGVACAMHRGFVEEIHCDVDTFLARIDAIVAIAPILHVKLRGAAGRGTEIARCPHLAQLQSLSFEQGQITDDDLAALANSPFIANLRWLDLAWNRITDRGVDALAAAHAPSLVCVNLANNPCTNPIDEQVFYDDTRYGWRTTERGAALEGQYGPIAWLHPTIDVWPPPMGVV